MCKILWKRKEKKRKKDGRLELNNEKIDEKERENKIEKKIMNRPGTSSEPEPELKPARNRPVPVHTWPRTGTAGSEPWPCLAGALGTSIG